MRCPVVIQHDEMDCGAACLAMIGRYYGIKMPLAKYRDLLRFDNNGTTVFDMIQAALHLGMHACSLKGTIDKLLEAVAEKNINFPCIALIKAGAHYHYVVIYHMSTGKVKYADPADGIHVISIEEFKKKYQNVVITINKAENFRKIKYKRKSISLIAFLVDSNIKIMCILFVLSLIIIALSLCGSLLIEFIVNFVIVHPDTSYHLDDRIHSTNVDNNVSLVASFNGLLAKMVDKPIVVLYIFLVIYGIRLFMELGKSFAVTRIACNIERQMSSTFFEKMISIPLNVFKGKKTGEYISRFTDVRRLNNFLVDIITTYILNLTFVFGFGAALFFISKQLFACTLLVTVLFATFAFLFQKIIRKQSFGVLQNNAQVVSVVEESIKGIELIKTYDLENNRKLMFEEKISKYIHTLRKFANLSFIHNNIANWISSFGNFLIIYIGVTMCIRGKMLISSLLIYYIISSNFMSAISHLICVQPEVSEAITAFQRVEDVLECESDIESCVGENINCIRSVELVNVGYRYGLVNQVLENFSLKIAKGEKIMIQGKNGSGKSTLAHILVGNFRDIQGGVIYEGKSNISLYSIRSNITYLNQDVFLFHDSIFNNLVVGCKNVSAEKFMQVCKMTGVDEFVDCLAEKYDYILSDNGTNLSGGQRQKIALARALLRNTPIYIFDESTSNLDQKAENMFLEIAKNYLKDKTVLIISHNAIFKDYVDKTYVLEKGRLLEC